jgi:hypothetical protein
VIFRRCIVASAVVLTWLGVAFPALAAEEAKVSWDGTAWADHIEGQLFTEPRYWVPGDESVGSFQVLNNSSDPAQVTVDQTGGQTIQTQIPTPAMFGHADPRNNTRHAGQSARNPPRDVRVK